MVKVEEDFPYVHLVTAKGRHYAYYRRDGAYLKIEGAFEVVLGKIRPSTAWKTSYAAIHERFGGTPVAAEAAPGSIAAAIDAYERSDDFRTLAPKTRSGYERYMTLMREGEADPEKDRKPIRAIADLPMAALTPRTIKELRSQFAGEPGSEGYRPAAANGYATFLRLFVRWHQSEKIKKLPTGEGHRPAEESEVRQFRAAWPADTVERVAFELALNTGQRGQDVIAMGREDLRDGEVRVVQEKTGERVWMPMTADLRAVIEPWMRDRIGPILVTEVKGRAIKEDYFRRMMRKAYDKAGLPEDFTTHGLRYTAATRIYEIYKSLGYPDRMAWEAVADITGHATMQMARKYSAKRRRTRLTVAHLDAALAASVKPAGGSVKPNRSEREE